MTEPLDYAILDRAGAEAIFFPRSDPYPPPAGSVDLVVEVAPGVAVGCRFYAHDPALPTILYFHGNGEVASDHDDIAPLYHAAGANLLVAEFRGYGRSGGRPSFANLVGDAHPVARWFHTLLDERGYPAARLVMGRSLGSHPALEIAANAPERFAGVIIESGAAGLQRLLDRFGAPDTAQSASLVAGHDRKIARISLPCVIIHGAADELVPLAQAERLAGLLGGAVHEKLVVPGAGHNDLLWVGRDAYFRAIRGLLDAVG